MYRSPLSNLADVDRLFLALDVKREERIGQPRVERILDPLLPCQRVGIGEIGAAASPCRGSQVFGRERMVQLRGFSEGLELSGTLVKSGIVDCAATGSGKGQVSQVDAAQVSELAVLGQQQGTRGGFRRHDDVGIGVISVATRYDSWFIGGPRAVHNTLMEVVLCFYS